MCKFMVKAKVYVCIVKLNTWTLHCHMNSSDVCYLTPNPLYHHTLFCLTKFSVTNTCKNTLKKEHIGLSLPLLTL